MSIIATSATAEQVWETLFKCQTPKIKAHAYSLFAESLDKLEFNAYTVPAFSEINRRLKEINGWQVYPVPVLSGYGLLLPQMKKYDCARQNRSLN